MAKEKIIKLNKASTIFPEKYSKVRAHDLINKSASKFLLKREKESLQNLASEIRNGNLFGENKDILAIRKGRRITFVPF